MKIKEKMSRRKFLKLSAAGAATTGAAALIVNSDWLFTATNTLENNLKTIPIDAKKTFLKCGTCSKTLFYLLNREFGYPKENEEHASDPLAGGLMSTQHQCGMLWGSALAVGAESFRMHNDRGKAIATAITATQHLMESFSKRAKTVNCRDITCDFSNKFDFAKFALKSLPGGPANMICMNLAEKWTPEAIQSAKEGLTDKQTDLPQLPVSCASEVAKKMGAGDEEMLMVAGFAGGMGLSGNACGALGAAIWLDTLAWCKKHPGKTGYSNPNSNEILKKFYDTTGSEILCPKISGQRFRTIGDHTEFIKNGGCDKIINVLARS
jgi:hypothetical protein